MTDEEKVIKALELTKEQILVLRNHLFNIEYLEGTYQYDVLKSIIKKLDEVKK